MWPEARVTTIELRDYELKISVWFKDSHVNMACCPIGFLNFRLPFLALHLLRLKYSVTNYLRGEMAMCAVVHGPEPLFRLGLFIWEVDVVMDVGWGTKPGRPSRPRCGPKKRNY